MPPHYLFTVDKDYHLALIHEEHAAGMVNVLRAEQKALQVAYRTYPNVPLFLDSAAPQGNTNIHGYAESIKRLAWRFQRFSNLDVLGDPDRSQRHYDQLCKQLPEDLQRRVVWIYQTNRTHSYRTRQHQLGKLHDVLMHSNYPVVGIGGLVPFLRRHGGVAKALSILEEIHEVFVETQTPTKAHLFGVGSPTLLLWAAQQPWIESLDSGKWLIALKSGHVLRLFGDAQNAENDLGLPLSPKEAAAINIRVIQRWLQPDAIHQLLLPLACQVHPSPRAFSPNHERVILPQSDVPPMVSQLSLWPSSTFV